MDTDEEIVELSQCLGKPDLLQEAELNDATALIANMSSFFNQPTLSDVRVQVGESVFYGHKFVLANSSDVLRTLLYEERWSSTGEGQAMISLTETEDCEAAFHLFLKYFYTAKVSLNLANIIGILCLADKYNVESLKLLCEIYMIDHCKTPCILNIHNAMNWYPWSKALHLKGLQNQIKFTIAWNAMDIMSGEEWLHIDYDFLQDLLSSSDLVIQCELDVFRGAERWLLRDRQAQDKSMQLSDYANKLFSLIRFPRMTISELQKVESSELMKDIVTRDILSVYLGKAYRFHSLCMAPIKDIQMQFTDAHYQPREYLRNQVNRILIEGTLRYAMQIEVKTSTSPLPDDKKDADWKVSYKKVPCSENWTLVVQCLDPTMNSANMCYETTVMILNDTDRIIQVVKPERGHCKRGQSQLIDVPIDNTAECKTMILLIKPVVNGIKTDSTYK